MEKKPLMLIVTDAKDLEVLQLIEDIKILRKRALIATDFVAELVGIKV